MPSDTARDGLAELWNSLPEDVREVLINIARLEMEYILSLLDRALIFCPKVASVYKDEIKSGLSFYLIND